MPGKGYSEVIGGLRWAGGSFVMFFEVLRCFHGFRCFEQGFNK